jgi:mannose-6-phosphate isomerase-like protein (cupin superfamily)
MKIGAMSETMMASLLTGNTLGNGQNSFVIAEWQDAGGPPDPPRLIAPRHVHHRDDEAWYVLEGILRVQSGENEIEARPGSAVLVPRGTPHTYWNAGPGRLRYLLIMTPNIFSLIQGIHALKERTPATLQQLFRNHDSELL